MTSEINHQLDWIPIQTKLLKWLALLESKDYRTDKSADRYMIASMLKDGKYDRFDKQFPHLEIAETCRQASLLYDDAEDKVFEFIKQTNFQTSFGEVVNHAAQFPVLMLLENQSLPNTRFIERTMKFLKDKGKVVSKARITKIKPDINIQLKQVETHLKSVLNINAVVYESFEEFAKDVRSYVDDALYDLSEAMEAATSMDDRLNDYRSAIESLGFTRNFEV